MEVLDSMKPWERRLIVEYYELTDRIEKLKAFIDNYENMDFNTHVGKDLLELQYNAMRDYHMILMSRMLLEGIEFK